MSNVTHHKDNYKTKKCSVEISEKKKNVNQTQKLKAGYI